MIKMEINKITNHGRNRRGQIGSTMTWMTAFVIIFFIMILFTTVVIVISGAREIPVVGSGGNRIIVKDYVKGDYAIQKELNVFLSLNMEGTRTIDFLKQGLGDKSKEKIFEGDTRKYFDSINNNCYSLCVISPGINGGDGEILIERNSCAVRFGLSKAGLVSPGFPNTCRDYETAHSNSTFNKGTFNYDSGKIFNVKLYEEIK